MDGPIFGFFPCLLILLSINKSQNYKNPGIISTIKWKFDQCVVAFIFIKTRKHKWKLTTDWAGSRAAACTTVCTWTRTWTSSTCSCRTASGTCPADAGGRATSWSNCQWKWCHRDTPGEHQEHSQGDHLRDRGSCGVWSHLWWRQHYQSSNHTRGKYPVHKECKNSMSCLNHRVTIFNLKQHSQYAVISKHCHISSNIPYVCN